jgi:hypothetical protein
MTPPHVCGRTYRASHDCDHINFTSCGRRFSSESKGVFSAAAAKNGGIVQILRESFALPFANQTAKGSFGGELAPLHGEIEQRAANVPIGCCLGDPVAFQGVGSAIVFGHRTRAPKVCITQPPESRFALNQFVGKGE